MSSVEKQIFAFIKKLPENKKDETLWETVFEKIENLGNYDLMNKDGYSLLTLSLSENLLKLTKFLLEHGADPNLEDEREAFPLFYTFSFEAVELLVKYGANVNVENWTGETFLFRSVKLDILNNSYKTNGKLIEFLLEHGADPNTQDKKE